MNERSHSKLQINSKPVIKLRYDAELMEGLEIFFLRRHILRFNQESSVDQFVHKLQYWIFLGL